LFSRKGHWGKRGKGGREKKAKKAHTLGVIPRRGRKGGRNIQKFFTTPHLPPQNVQENGGKRDGGILENTRWTMVARERKAARRGERKEEETDGAGGMF